MKDIRVLALDMGGVLTYPQRVDKAAELRETLRQAGGPGSPAIGAEAFSAAYFGRRADYDRGTCDAASYWAAVGRDLGVEVGPSLARELVRIDIESWFTMRPAMLDFIGGAARNLRSLVLLSNINEDGGRYLIESCPWASGFDVLILSYEHRLLKPEPEIYALALERAGSSAGEEFSPRDCLFVDDSQANVEGARAAGLSSFRFVDEADFASRIASSYRFSR